MTDQTNTEASTETTAPAKRTRKAAPAKDKSKVEVAASIFKRFSRGKVRNRAKIIEAFQKEAGLSKNGAATYYQSLKAKADGKKAA